MDSCVLPACKEGLPLIEGLQASHGRELGKVPGEIHQGLLNFQPCERALEWIQKDMH